MNSLKPCRSPYCECEQDKCTHPGFYDARDDEACAARYRWLRDHSHPTLGTFYLSVTKAFTDIKWTRKTVDASIDEQIKRDQHAIPPDYKS